MATYHLPSTWNDERAQCGKVKKAVLMLSADPVERQIRFNETPGARLCHTCELGYKARGKDVPKKESG